METTIERLKNQVLAGQPLADVTVLDLLGKLELLQQEALEAQEDAIHQTARAEQAEAQVRRVREVVGTESVRQVHLDLSAGAKQTTEYGNNTAALIAYTEGVEHATTILTSRITRILNGEAND